MQNLSRRSFLGAAGMMGAASVMGAASLAAPGGIHVIDVAAAEESTAEHDDYEGASGEGAPAVDALRDFDNAWSGPGSADGSWTGTPAALEAVGGSNMPLDELNRRRKAYLDAQTDYVCENGTVIPAVYVKARASQHLWLQHRQRAARRHVQHVHARTE